MTRHLPVLALLLALAPCRGVGGSTPPLTSPPSAPLAPMNAPGPQDRILVVAPHPDDESLCCAGLLQRARARGATVGVVWITAGDSFEFDAIVVERSLWPGKHGLLALGRRRLAEAHEAADRLGVPRSAQYLLGYPDRGVVPLLGPYRQRPYRSRYTGLTAIPYRDALSPGASYTRANLTRDLARVLDQFRPTLVLAAAPMDSHPDHHGSGELVHELLAQRGELGKLRYWIVHAPHWPWPRRLNPALSLNPPAAAAALSWQVLPLSGEERAGKLAALRAHRTQMALMAPYMESFVRANELFASEPAVR